MADARNLRLGPKPPIFHWLALGITQILGLASGVMQILALGKPKYTNMLVSPTQNPGVGGTAQRQPPTPGILRRSGI